MGGFLHPLNNNFLCENILGSNSVIVFWLFPYHKKFSVSGIPSVEKTLTRTKSWINTLSVKTEQAEGCLIHKHEPSPQALWCAIQINHLLCSYRHSIISIGGYYIKAYHVTPCVHVNIALMHDLFMQIFTPYTIT